MLLTFLFSCLFLFLNSALISKLLPPLLESGPAFLTRPAVVQATLFAGPVFLVFVEWWLADLVVELVTPQRDVEPLPRRSGPADTAWSAESQMHASFPVPPRPRKPS